MKIFNTLTLTLSLLMTLLIGLPADAMAQEGEERRIEFFSENATMEDDPKQGVYNITIFSPDGEWKMQLNYHADSMFGTFGNDDFLLSTTGRNYNYVRNPKNDMVFYSFVDMDVSVAAEETVYRVQANCLTNNRMRFIVEATIPAPKAKETRSDNMGYARVEQNPFYGTWAIYAENDNYKLGYGVVSPDLLGTFYRADMLMPELYDKQSGQPINIIYGTAVHTQDGENTLLHVNLLSDAYVEYSLDMFNGPYQIDITGEQDILIGSTALQDLTEVYGCYLFGGSNGAWGMAIAVKPEVLASGRTSWTRDDLVMQYTRLVTLPDMTQVEIFDISAELTVGLEGDMTLCAEVTGMNGILYHVTMVSREVAPEVTETVNIDFGRVAVLDYTRGIGTVGLGAVQPEAYQMRCYFRTHELEGDFTNADVLLDMSDIMVVNRDRGTYVFHDAQYVTAHMERQGDDTHITIDMIGVDNVLYHATMTLQDMTCMHDMEINVDESNARMVAIQEDCDGESAEYTLQFQDIDSVYDADYNIVGDGYALSYYFSHEGVAAIGGDYGYSAGTLAEDEWHTFFEHGCEVRVAPVAGTLALQPLQQGVLNIGALQVTTYLYKIASQFVGQNGAIYTLAGNNFLLCADSDGNYISMDEGSLSAINAALAPQGLRVGKVLKNGQVLIQKDDASYDLQGVRR